MDTITPTPSTYRMGGILAISGALSMVAGAICWGTSGSADLWKALDSGQISDYINKLAGTESMLAANTSFWILGVLLLGSAGSLMKQLSPEGSPSAHIALTSVRTAVPLAIVAFFCMLAPAIQVAPDASEAAVSLTATVGWLGTRMDDLATVLIVGVFPFFISIAGKDSWVPRWLRIWSWIALLAGIIAILRMYQPALAAPSMLIIPVGLGWMIGAGIVLIRKAKN